MPIGRGRHLNLSITGRGQRIEVKKFHVVGTKLVLTGVLVVVTFALNQGIARFYRWAFVVGPFNIITKDQQRC